MKNQWQYKFLDFTVPSKDVQKILNDYGIQEYELVSADIKQSTESGMVNLVAFLKREADPKTQSLPVSDYLRPESTSSTA